MIAAENDVQEVLCDALSAEIDLFLEGHGFERKRNSIEYKRLCKDGEQSLRMHFEFQPNYHPGADSRIYPMIRVVFPKLNETAFEMVDHVRLLIGDPEITFSQPIDTAIPKDQHIRWYTSGRESIFDRVRSIRSYLERWVVPFLNEYTTIGSIAAAYEKHDERLEWQRHFYIYVSAAYVLLGQLEKAKQVLEDKFGKAGPRRKYAKAFEYVAGHIENDLRPHKTPQAFPV